MNYRVMLVDDEETIRRGMESFVNWEALGFEVVASLPDGRDAIAYLKKHTVDLVITDIKMTFISGLDLAKYIFENQISTKVVMLSAYDKFDFAVEAIKYSVEDYILKSASPTEIEEVLRGIYLKLNLDKKQNNKYMSKIATFLKEQFLENLFTGNISSKEEIYRNVRLFDADIDLECAKVKVYEPVFENFDEYLKKTWKYGEERFYNAFRNYFDGKCINGKYIYYYKTSDPMYILMLITDDIETDKVVKEFEDLFKIKITLLPIVESNSIFEVPILQEDKKEIERIKNEYTENFENEKSTHYIISDACKYIKDNIYNDTNLNDVANNVYISPAYLSRLFKKETSMNFKDYVIMVKMDKAMELLKEPQFKVYEVSEILGYKSARFFSKTFKKHTGCNPSEYRAEYIA